ncbi:MAG: pyridoxine 5'-phosphate synthase [Ignavibacteriales bacterium]|nr:Pyridoxine 5'-phosphate synthase [Ignavibacteriaceae bacterium]QOJ29136.1 MAG: pyridoxine 5'-phosphate synthase [Ignavibacteriales bacterium]
MRFCINVDHVATLRNARNEREPDPVTYALMAELAGVDGIVVHLREDRRHINERDLAILKRTIKTKLDLEMAATEEIIRIACEIKPQLATIVPEKRLELTTEGGISVVDNIQLLSDAIKELHKYEIPVSLFIEPDINQIDASAELEADFIEIHTGNFANAKKEEEQFDELDKIRVGAKHAKKLGLGVNAGHGLDYNNIRIFRELKDIDEVSIGHAVIARSMYVGVKQAVEEMTGLIKGLR